MVLGIATVIALVFASETLLAAHTSKVVPRVRIFWELSGWYLWCAFLPLILKLVRRYPLDQTALQRLVFIHIPAGLLFGSMQFGAQVLIARSYHFIPEAVFLHFLSWRFIVYFQIIVVCYAFDFARRGKEQEIKSSHLKARIAELQLQALKTQLRPAFLFDTLNSLSRLIQKDVEEADSTIALVGDFLRMTLENSRAKEIPIRTEMDFLHCYLRIERTWLRDRLQVDLDIDATYMDAVIPNLLLQPIVECAIYNKKEADSDPIRIALKIRGASGFLHITVQENADVLIAEPFEDPRLRSIGARLQEIYGNDYEFKFRIVPQMGLDAQVKLPVHFAEVESQALQGWLHLGALPPENIPEESRNNVAFLHDPDRVKSEGAGTGKRMPQWFVVFAVWTGINLYFLGRNLLLHLVNDKPINWREAGWVALAWYLWAALTPAVLWTANRFPLQKPRLFAKLILHMFASVFFWLTICALFALMMFFMQSEKTYLQLLSEGLLSYGFALDLLAYWSILSVNHAARYYRSHQLQRISAFRLELELLESQIQALHMQLHPHFLFNTLHSISELIHEDVPAAQQMLERLMCFLKLTLENSGTQQVPLEKELEFLECYLEIQQVRFQDRLKVTMAIDEGTRQLLVPNLVLQPIVENAIRYGIAPRTECGMLEIRAERKNATLHLEVRDDGPGLSIHTFREGLGLSNTRARLQQLYGGSQRMSLQNAPAGGLMVRLEIPVQSEAVGAL